MSKLWSLVITHKLRMLWTDDRLKNPRTILFFLVLCCPWWVCLQNPGFALLHSGETTAKLIRQCSIFTLSLPPTLVLLGDGHECVPREGPAGGLPYQGQPGPDCVPTGHGANGWEPHRRAGWHSAQPFQKVPAPAKPVCTQPVRISHSHDLLTPIFSLICSTLK